MLKCFHSCPFDCCCVNSFVGERLVLGSLVKHFGACNKSVYCSKASLNERDTSGDVVVVQSTK